MRKMKTTMDVQIRQTKSRSFQGGDQAIRQAASRGMSSAFALRQEVLSELPDQYRKMLSSMSPREQERLLSKVEASVNRKVSSGAMARTAVRLDERERREIQRIAAEGAGSRDARKQAIVSRYRLQEMKQRAGPNDTLLSVPADSPQMRRYIEETLGRQPKGQTSGPSTLQETDSPATGRNRFMRTMAEYPSSDVTTMRESVIQPPSDTKPAHPEQLKAVQREYRQKHAAGGNSSAPIEPVEKPSGAQGLSASKVQGAKDAFIEKTARHEAQQNKERASSPQPENISKDVNVSSGIISTEFDSTQDLPIISVKPVSELASPTADIPRREQVEEAKLHAALTQYQQSLLASAKSGKEQRQIEAAMQKAVSGNAGRKEQILLRNASQQAAFSERHTTDAYRELLTGAGIQTDGQKAAIQMAYEKQVRTVLKNTYRKELIGRLAKQKTSAVMKQAEQKKYQREREQENELNRAMSDQARSAFGMMSKAGRVFRKAADGALKAIKGLVNRKMFWLIIPVILVAAVPFVMTALPLMSMITSTSYEDNEVYAYADASELIAYAQQWIGKIPYVWGGGHGGSATAWQNGCDCSGFVHGVFNHFGYEIGGDTGAMETQAGTHIAYDSLANAKPGDVIIYYRTGAHMKGDPGGGLRAALRYICNPKKAEAVGGSAGTDGDKAYETMKRNKEYWHKPDGSQGFHYIISFPPDCGIDVNTAAHAAEDFAEELLQGNYYYTFAVHTDHAHMHIHIVFDSVSATDGVKYHSPKGDWENRIQPISDRICRKYGLPELEYGDASRNVDHSEWQNQKRRQQQAGGGGRQSGPERENIGWSAENWYKQQNASESPYPRNWYDLIRDDIDEAILHSSSYEAFLRYMESLEYTVRDGKYLSLKAKGRQRAVRTLRLGRGYSKEEIQQRIEP